MQKLGLILFSICISTLIGGFIYYKMQVNVPTRQFDESSLFHPSNFNEQRFAHRGGYAFGPENTVETILQNIRQRNITAIEVDVMMSKDGELFLFHDDYVDRLLKYNEKRLFTDFTAQELSGLSLRDTTFGEIGLTTLAQLVDSLRIVAINDQLPILLELDFKPNGDQTIQSVDALMEIVNDQEEEIGEAIYEFFFVSTFFPEMLAEFRSRSDKIVTAFGVHSDSPKNKWAARTAILAAHFLVKKHQVSIIEPNLCLVTPTFTKRWNERGILVNTYTVNSYCEKEYMGALPVAYTTNCPGEVCTTDEEEGLGPPRNWCKSCDLSSFD